MATKQLTKQSAETTFCMNLLYLKIQQKKSNLKDTFVPASLRVVVKNNILHLRMAIEMAKLHTMGENIEFPKKVELLKKVNCPS